MWFMYVVVDPVWDGGLLWLVAVERNFGPSSEFQDCLLPRDGPGTSCGCSYHPGVVTLHFGSFLPVYLDVFLRGFSCDARGDRLRSGDRVRESLKRAAV